MITKIYIKNYKSIEKAELELSKVNVLIGPNGSGKSSVLECVEHFRRAIESGYSSTGEYSKGHYIERGTITPMLIPHFKYVVFQHDESRHIIIKLDLNLNINDQIYQAYYTLQISPSLTQFHFETEGFTDSIPKLKEILTILILWSNRKIPRALRGVFADVHKINVTNAHQLFYYTCYRSEFKENIQIVKDFYAKYGLHDIRWVPTAEEQYEIIATTDEGVDVNLADVGSGLNALFPIVVALAFYPENSTIFIEHPEMHLHPKLQYELAEFLLDVSKKRNYQLVLETHSEHLLYGLLNAVARKELESENLTIYSARKERGRSIFEKLKVYEDGSVEGNLQDFLEADIDAFLDFLKA